MAKHRSLRSRRLRSDSSLFPRKKTRNYKPNFGFVIFPVLFLGGAATVGYLLYRGVKSMRSKQAALPAKVAAAMTGGAATTAGLLPIPPPPSKEMKNWTVDDATAFWQGVSNIAENCMKKVGAVPDKDGNVTDPVKNAAVDGCIKESTKKYGYDKFL